ncbi:hypothetical protein OPT61_g9638 [Boeremia exigua]|uniref:Uncharacterized protein n=1 Tax=Boeremia exigua TaxID=749465 RepID=A0ACC2HTJ0_9PLEO|nr:hypothetical protein OPT61_g9638 [Boeremia exigua]
MWCGKCQKEALRGGGPWRRAMTRANDAVSQKGSADVLAIMALVGLGPAVRCQALDRQNAVRCSEEDGRLDACVKTGRLTLSVPVSTIAYRGCGRRATSRRARQWAAAARPTVINATTNAPLEGTRAVHRASLGSELQSSDSWGQQIWCDQPLIAWRANAASFWQSSGPAQKALASQRAVASSTHHQTGQQAADQASGPACSGLDARCARMLAFPASSADSSETSRPRVSRGRRGLLQMRDGLEEAFALAPRVLDGKGSMAARCFAAAAALLTSAHGLLPCRPPPSRGSQVACPWPQMTTCKLQHGKGQS